MKFENWNKIGTAYSAVKDARRDTVFGFIQERLKQACPQSLLDYGGGDGLFALSAAGFVSEQTVVYDPAPSMVDLARKNCAANSRVRVVQSSKELPDGDFDVVALNAVWMCLPTEKDCSDVLRDIHRLLKPGGELIASVTHPCFRDRKFSTYHADFDMRNYLKDETQFRVTIFDGSREIEVVDTHWTLSAMSRQMDEAGIAVTEFVELPDQPENGNGGSPWLVIIAKKLK